MRKGEGLRPEVSKREGLYFFLFLFLSCIYFHGIFTSGLIPLPGDAYAQNYPLKHLYGESLKNLQLPLWNPYEFAGLPFVGAMQTGALYPLNILLYGILPIHYAFNASLLLHFAMAGFFTFLYLRLLGIGRLPAFFGGAVFAFSGFIASHKPHTAILNASVYLPLIIYFFEQLKREPGLKYMAGLSLSIAVQLLAGNFQMCIYTYIVLCVFFVFAFFEMERIKRARFVLLSAGALSSGFLMALPQILLTAELSGFSLRPVIRQTMGYLFSSEFHVHMKTLPSLIFPHLYIAGGYGAHLPTPPATVVAFTGILPIVLALLVLFRNRSQAGVRLWGVVAFLGLLLAVADDTPLGRSLFRLPVYGMLRAHGRNLYEFSFAVSVLFAIGMNALISTGKNLKAALIALAGILAVSIAAVITVRYAGIAMRGVIGFGNPAFYIPLLITLGYILCLLLYHLRPKRLFLYSLLLLVFIEAYSFGAFFEAGGKTVGELNGICKNKGYEFMTDREHGRPFRLARLDDHTTDLFNAACGAGSLNSYDQLAPKEYLELFDLEPLGYSRYWSFLIENNTLLSMANVKYLIVPKKASSYVKIIEGVMTAEKKPLQGEVRINPNVYLLSPPKDRQKNIASFSWSSGAGTYLLLFKARAVKDGGASLRMEVYGNAEKAGRFSLSPLHAYPGIIGPARQYHRVYVARHQEEVTLSLIAPTFEPVEITDISISEIQGYGPPPAASGGKVYEKVHETEDTMIYLNRNSLPRAYSVSELVKAEDLEEVKKMFALNEINPGHQAVLYKKDMEAVGTEKFSKGDVFIKEYGLHKAVIETDFPGKGFLVLSDQYYPGWRAYVDGRGTRILRVNGIMRGVIVPSGRHEVVFRYVPSNLAVSASLSLLALAVAVLLYLKKPTAD
ncbi:MAG: YfhO family protein [Thermodesulfovibrionales bacterium]|nr:YfhO family protein [Thermodesulfovibrionales bacterium]